MTWFYYVFRLGQKKDNPQDEMRKFTFSYEILVELIAFRLHNTD
ncbi:hypothetical protein V202x_07330 [Gimesia aquarii]|uniref:Uncharacterized protein n=1 Tax=Gimesia aquarii TaxID=2527964 RepID=A0A517WQ44_9PLAN|nr:hypothetical protein V202x_07330 [Gimesia aquarii]